MTSRIPTPILTLTDCSDEDYRDELCNVSTMSRSASPPIENVIRAFNAELDSFTKSFDDMASSIKKTATTPSYSRRPVYLFSTAKKSTPTRVRDPPPSVDRISPMRTQSHSTPSRRVQQTARSYSPEEPPPAPIETPAFFTSPKATPNPRRNEYSSTRKEFRPPSAEAVSKIGPKDWEDALNKMRQTLLAQEARIKELELENESLKAQVHNQSGYSHDDPHPERLYRGDDDNHERSPWRDNSAYSREARSVHRGDPDGDRSRYSGNNPGKREEPQGRRPPPSSHPYEPTPTSTPMRGPRSPPSRIRTTTPHMIPEEEVFTPGTRFVVELSELMKMDEDHHAPLSYILDKHWDRLKHHFRDVA